MPVFTSAVVRVFKAMKAAGVRFRGFDVEVYSRPFTDKIEIAHGRPTLGAFRDGRLTLPARGRVLRCPDAALEQGTLPSVLVQQRSKAAEQAASFGKRTGRPERRLVGHVDRKTHS
jgi:hypothetical protein